MSFSSRGKSSQLSNIEGFISEAPLLHVFVFLYELHNRRMPHRKPTTDQSTAEIRRVQVLVHRSATPDKILALPTSLFALTTSLEHRLRETRRSYRAKSLLVHPDRCTDVGAKSAFQALQDAYEHIVLHGWVPPHLPASTAGASTTTTGGGSPATPPHPNAAARMAEMEAWMRRAHQSYFRGRRRCSGGGGLGGGASGGAAGGRKQSYRDLAEDVMAGLDAAGGWGSDDDEHDDEFAAPEATELMAWLKTVHQRSGMVGKKSKPLFSLNRRQSRPNVENDDDDDDDEDDDDEGNEEHKRYNDDEDESVRGRASPLANWTAAARAIASFRPYYTTTTTASYTNRSPSSPSSSSSASGGDDDDDDYDDDVDQFAKPRRKLQVKNPTLKRRRDLLRPSSPASAAFS
ncbi:hypothetical protein BDZ88DRAFT_468108 [Geranomyces variabilis]|nr:hypothetical protein BDZ88DRAFT_468108 [Geranomyces variabilis]